MPDKLSAARPLTFGGWTTAWIDLVGMTNLFLGLDAVAASRDPAVQTAAIDRVMAPTNRLRAVFEALAAGWVAAEESGESDAVGRLTPAQRALLARLSATELHVQHVADAISASVSMQTEAPEVGIWLLLRSVAWTWIGMMATGYPSRCAIEIGVGAKLDERELLSSSGVKAYILESKEAHWFRIVVGPHLVQELVRVRDGVTLVGSSFVRTYRSRLAAECLDLLEPTDSPTGGAEVNYMHREVLGASPEKTCELLQDAHAFLQREEARLTMEGHREHAAKFRRTLASLRARWPAGLHRVDLP